MAKRQSAVQDDFHAEGLEVDVPGFDQRIQERDTVLNRHVEDIRVQELENHYPHLLIASIAELSHQAEPVFTFQFLLGDSLGHVQELLGDEALKLAERLLLKNPAYFSLTVGVAFA